MSPRDYQCVWLILKTQKKTCQATRSFFGSRSSSFVPPPMMPAHTSAAERNGCVFDRLESAANIVATFHKARSQKEQSTFRNRCLEYIKLPKTLERGTFEATKREGEDVVKCQLRCGHNSIALWYANRVLGRGNGTGQKPPGSWDSLIPIMESDSSGTSAELVSGRYADLCLVICDCDR